MILFKIANTLDKPIVLSYQYLNNEKQVLFNLDPKRRRSIPIPDAEYNKIKDSLHRVYLTVTYFRNINGKSVPCMKTLSLDKWIALKRVTPEFLCAIIVGPD